MLRWVSQRAAAGVIARRRGGSRGAAIGPKAAQFGHSADIGGALRSAPGSLRYIARMSRRIAIVEDEPAIRDNLRDALVRHGFEVQGFGDRRDAQTAFASRLPDMAIIDVGLGDEPDGGFELCRWLRERASVLPILMLSARDSEIDIVSGLRLGADDYLTKNVSLPHLLCVSPRCSGASTRWHSRRGRPSSWCAVRCAWTCPVSEPAGATTRSS